MAPGAAMRSPGITLRIRRMAVGGAGVVQVLPSASGAGNGAHPRVRTIGPARFSTRLVPCGAGVVEAPGEPRPGAEPVPDGRCGRPRVRATWRRFVGGTSRQRPVRRVLRRLQHARADLAIFGRQVEPLDIAGPRPGHGSGPRSGPRPDPGPAPRPEARRCCSRAAVAPPPAPTAPPRSRCGAAGRRFGSARPGSIPAGIRPEPTARAGLDGSLVPPAAPVRRAVAGVPGVTSSSPRPAPAARRPSPPPAAWSPAPSRQVAPARVLRRRPDGSFRPVPARAGPCRTGPHVTPTP